MWGWRICADVYGSAISITVWTVPSSPAALFTFRGFMASLISARLGQVIDILLLFDALVSTKIYSLLKAMLLVASKFSFHLRFRSSLQVSNAPFRSLIASLLLFCWFVKPSQIIRSDLVHRIMENWDHPQNRPLSLIAESAIFHFSCFFII